MQKVCNMRANVVHVLRAIGLTACSAGTEATLRPNAFVVSEIGGDDVGLYGGCLDCRARAYD